MLKKLPEGNCSPLQSSLVRVAGAEEESIVDGPGVRFVLFVQGCRTRCPGCQNPQTWDFGGGTVVSAREILDRILRDPLVHGVTFSGGEPFEQAPALAPLAAELKRRGYHLMSYSGFTLEQILARPECLPFLSLLDVLVDGPFVEEERSLDLLFRGSANQRLIDVPASLRNGGSPVLWRMEN